MERRRAKDSRRAVAGSRTHSSRPPGEPCTRELPGRVRENVWVGDNVSLDNLLALIVKHSSIDFLCSANRLATEPSTNAVWANQAICENATAPCAQFAHCGSASKLRSQSRSRLIVPYFPERVSGWCAETTCTKVKAQQWGGRLITPRTSSSGLTADRQVLATRQRL